jgi:hypothetical protein
VLSDLTTEVRVSEEFTKSYAFLGVVSKHLFKGFADLGAVIFPGLLVHAKSLEGKGLALYLVDSFFGGELMR